MANYLISYDLNKPGQNYSNVHEAIKRIANGYCHILESTWIIGHDGSASAIRDAIGAVTDSRDELFVVKLANDWATLNIDKQKTDWLHQHL